MEPIYVVIGAIVVVIIVLMVFGGQAERAREQARAAYQQSLSRVKADPANADLRQRALQLGRVYSNLTRNQSGVTIFDEVALMNDINAACAGASTLKNSATASAAGQSVEVRLQKLAALRTKGLIDESEYRTQKLKILDEV
jgi:hypothetical protein